VQGEAAGGRLAAAAPGEQERMPAVEEERERRPEEAAVACTPEAAGAEAGAVHRLGEVEAASPRVAGR